MLVERLYLTDDNRVHLTAYIQDRSSEIKISGKRPVVLVCPGGGYQMTSDREAEPVALSYLANGFNTFVLRYSIGTYAKYPAPVVDLSKAMKMIRDNAERWYCDPEKIAVCGFSAGGHLTATLGTLWNDKEVQKLSGCENGENRPNALILGYPVISSGVYAHEGCFETLLSGCTNIEKIKEKVSCEKNVGSHTPPSFIFHTFMDNDVPVENVLLFAKSLSNFNIPFEMHIFQDGAHGISLANHCTYANAYNLDESVAQWMSLSCNWLWNLFGKQVPDKGIKLNASQRRRGTFTTGV